MISTGTDRSTATLGCDAVPPNRGAAVRHSVAIALAAILAITLGGCSSTMPRVSSKPGLQDTNMRQETMMVPAFNGDRQAPAQRVIQIEPDPQRDEEVHALLRGALDGLRSGEIQPALDLLLQAQSIEGWTRSEHAPAVLFWTGHSYDQLGERFAAMGAFRRITIQYPRSAFAERASRRLRELRSRSPQAAGSQR